MVNPLQKIRDRIEARRARKQLATEHQFYIDRLTSAIWSDRGDIGLAMADTEIKINRDAAVKGFDPQTVIMLIQLALLIYQTLKRLNVMSPSTEMVTALFEGE